MTKASTKCLKLVVGGPNNAFPWFARTSCRKTNGMF